MIAMNCCQKSDPNWSDRASKQSRTFLLEGLPRKQHENPQKLLTTGHEASDIFLKLSSWPVC